MRKFTKHSKIIIDECLAMIFMYSGCSDTKERSISHLLTQIITSYGIAADEALAKHEQRALNSIYTDPLATKRDYPFILEQLRMADNDLPF